MLRLTTCASKGEASEAVLAQQHDMTLAPQHDMYTQVPQTDTQTQKHKHARSHPYLQIARRQRDADQGKATAKLVVCLMCVGVRKKALTSKDSGFGHLPLFHQKTHVATSKSCSFRTDADG